MVEILAGKRPQVISQFVIPTDENKSSDPEKETGKNQNRVRRLVLM